MAPAQAGAMNDQASDRRYSQWNRDYGDAWRAQLRLAGLARSDQVTQDRLNSTPIAKRGAWRWPNVPMRIPRAQSGASDAQPGGPPGHHLSVMLGRWRDHE